jgi:hypothetical protein
MRHTTNIGSPVGLRFFTVYLARGYWVDRSPSTLFTPRRVDSHWMVTHKSYQTTDAQSGRQRGSR